MGLGAVICSLYMAFSRFGSIKLGDVEKPQYTAFQWGSMMFTAGLAADILFYSLCEWMLYADESHISEMGSIQDWTSVYPLFHWGPIPWSFYIILAVAFGFMIHVRRRNKQKYSEACRPLLGKKVDGVVGKLIDLTAVFALLAGTATTFSLATPLLSMALSKVLGVAETPLLTIAILVIICIVYTLAVYFGMQGVTRLAASCIYLFFVLLAYFLFLGGQTRYIIETGITAIGLLTQNFISLATWTDALRTSSFPQNWTIFYWAYWMVCGNPVLYWNHQQGKDHPPDCFRRLFLWSCWHLYFFYHIGKLWSGTSDSWDLRFNGTVPGDRGSVSGDHRCF